MDTNERNRNLAISKGPKVKRYERFKGLIKFIFSFNAVFFVAMVYWIVWNNYYNKIIQMPFWRKGNWLMVALYTTLLIFFYRTYGGFKISYLKKGNLIWSQILSIIATNLITYIQISLLDKRFHSVCPMFLMSFVEFGVVAIWVILFQWLYQKLFPARRLLLVYGNYPVFHLEEKIHLREDKYILANAVSVGLGQNQIMNEAKKYDAVIIGDIPSNQRNRLLKQCFEQSIRTYIVPKISDVLLRSSVELDVFDSPLLLSRNEELSLEQRFLKRLFDIIISTVGLVLALPCFAVIALLIKITDNGPVFYCQDRLTKNGKIFRIYKFRTMVQNAECRTGAMRASQNDGRILPIGVFLRRMRLDELPQFLNILKGEMSLVGPRPERPELAKEIEKEIPEFTYRLKFKAGLTGYAQVYGKYNTTFYDKLKLDLMYIRNYSLFLDLKLLLLTPKILFMKESTEGVRQENSQREEAMWQKEKKERENES